MKRKFVVPLSQDGINQLIKGVKEFRKWQKEKANELLQAMLDYGEDFALNAVGHVDTGETIDSVVGYRNGNVGVIVAGGNALWLEFGTGVRYNGSVGSSPHPEGAKNGMLIGTYGKGQGANPNGWWYYDGGKLRHTYGIKAQMFMYKTVRELEQTFPDMVREVFK